MCGIIGVVGSPDATNVILKGLQRLEYRGYDSAGLATVSRGTISVRRAEGKLRNLADNIAKTPLNGYCGIGHTRWATHGEPIERNAHPHAMPNVAVVHNGIIENYKALRELLEADGAVFLSDTDSEVVVQFTSRLLDQGWSPREAVCETLKHLHGSYALAFVFTGRDDLIVAARRGSPLVIGYGGSGEVYLGSDAVALAPMTSQVSYLMDGDCVEIVGRDVQVYDETGVAVARPITQASVDGSATELNGHEHYMIKEIMEQPPALSTTITAYLDPFTSRVKLPPIPFDLAEIDRITMVACGTAYYAALTARYWLEEIAGIPVEVEVASEFRYRHMPLSSKGLFMCVSQSGETADTLASLRHAKEMGQRVMSVVNVVESSIARDSDAILPTIAGAEIGVASTKAYTTQLMVLAAFTLAVAKARGTISEAQEDHFVSELRAVPAKVFDIVNDQQRFVEIAAKALAGRADALYLGRGTSAVCALEGALKLKEISYIHAEGYPAGEMKHGPIALIDDATPIIIIAPSDDLFEKTASNAHEAKARKGRIILLTDAAGAVALSHVAEHVIVMPETERLSSPIIYAIAMQLLAYHTARHMGLDIDKPRNLAKSVTVE